MTGAGAPGGTLIAVFGDRSIQLFRIFGIRIGASPSWFLVLFLMIYWLSSYFSDVLVDSSNTVSFGVAVAATVLFFVSLLLHELGHALAARRFGIGTSGIDLWLFGGVAKLTRDSKTPKEEFIVAAAGPAVTAIIVGVCIGAGALASKMTGVVDTATFQDVEHDAVDRADRLARADQPRPADLQPDPGLPARRRADRARDRVEGHRRPQPRHALLARAWASSSRGS